MRFMMIQFPKVYETAKPGWVPDLKAMEVMGKYNEEPGKAGVLLALEWASPIPASDDELVVEVRRQFDLTDFDPEVQKEIQKKFGDAGAEQGQQ
jgi:hypothetical protein